MNDAHDNAHTDREMLDKARDFPGFITRATRNSGLLDIIDQMTEDEATMVLQWLANYKPDAMRSALRTAVSYAPRVHTLYRQAGRPHS